MTNYDTRLAKILLLLVSMITSLQVYADDESINPNITSPIAGSILKSGAPIFTWSEHSFAGEVTQYYLSVGSTPGGTDYHHNFHGRNLSAKITGLPNDGSTIYVQLWYKTAEGWSSTPSIEYIASDLIPPEITTPLPGSTLDFNNVNITWAGNSLADDITQYYISAGSTPGATDYHNEFHTQNLSTEITGLPNDGSTVYVQLWYKTVEGWSSTPSIEYIASDLIPPEITTPLPGSTLDFNNVNITWAGNSLADDITQYYISAGSTPGATDYHSEFHTQNLSTDITGLPNDGSKIYIKLWFKLTTGWQPTPDVEYFATTMTPPRITFPAAGSTIETDTTTFNWVGNSIAEDVIQYYLSAGSTPGAKDYYAQYFQNTLTAEVTGLPNDGSKFYTQLWYKTTNGWASEPSIEYTSGMVTTNCAGAISDSRNVKVTNLPKPEFNQLFEDPVFGSKIKRITDAQQGEVFKPAYSTVQAWNSDESLMLLYRTGNGSGHVLLDGRTYDQIQTLDILPADIEEVFWSHTDPAELFYVSQRSEDFGQFKRYDVETNSSSYITDFSQHCGVNGLPLVGEDLHMQSLDDDLFGFRCVKEDGTQMMLSYRISTDTTFAKPIGEGTGWDDDTAPIPSPSGDRFWYQGKVLSTDLETIETSLDLGNINEHSNIGMTHGGHDALYQTAFEPSPDGCNTDPHGGVGHLIEHNLKTGECRSLISEYQGYPYTTSNTHVSAQAYKKPGLVAMSSVGTSEQLNEFLFNDIEAPALLSEIYLSNSNPVEGGTCRLAHHRSFGSHATNGSYPAYFGEPHVTISPSGTRILFGSDWYDSGSVDSYIIELPGYND